MDIGLSFVLKKAYFEGDVDGSKISVREARFQSKRVFNFLISSYFIGKTSVRSKDGSRILATSKTKLFATIIDGFQPLTNVINYKRVPI